MTTNRKILTFTVAILTTVTLAACQKSTKQGDSAKEATSSKVVKKADKATPKKVAAKKSGVMNLAQIKAGNYSSLIGDWAEIKSGVNKQDATGIHYTSGGTDQLTISKNQITAGEMQLADQTLTDNNGEHQLDFKTKNNVLSATLSSDAAINWSVSFYPKGTSDASLKQVGIDHSSKNIILIWTSNNSYTQVFAQQSQGESTKSSANLNVNQISNDNFASLVGTWKNPTDGKTIIVSSKIIKRPAGSTAASSEGVAVHGDDSNGYSNVIISGRVEDGYVLGGYGAFDPEAQGSTFSPLAIVPKNVKISDDDDSDSTRDRLIMSGGQSGYKNQAYYRE